MTRILIVDDKEENLYYLQALLTGHNCIVDTARHGAEALIRARQVRPDLVVSDLLMPVMDGYTLLRHWKADSRLRSAPFIVYTATYTEEADERLALDLGADAFILKPAEPEDFIARLKTVLARATAAVPVPPKGPVGDEKTLLKIYSETLIRKLEEKTLQLEETNRALQRDIAERKAVEAELRRREEEFRTLTETMPQIVWMTRPDGWHTHFNQRWMDYTGLTLEQSLGDGWIPPFHPDDRPRAAQRWREAVASGRIYEIEYRLRRADGVYHWMLGRAVPLRDASGAIVKWFGTCTDIDELKQAQARIGEQAALLDQTQDAVIVRDLQHRILYWNKGAERIYGWTAAEAVGRSAADLFYRDLAPLRAAMETLLRQGEWSGELCHLTKTRTEVAIEGRWSLIRDERGAPKSVLGVNTDVTERKKIEAQFLRAQRLESVGALAGGVAHDLNNMLAPIVMGVSLLKTGETDPDRLQTIELMERSALRGTNLVKQVLSFTRGVDASR
ncbi:MAG: PAS domain S-box protein, partial [Verrucomicrobia bacterium]|nr:PAS domain S-box protein [Verrucomicrobiota bacterium]